MKRTLSITKSAIQCSLIGAILGFLVGDLLIGVNIWLINSIKTGHWGSSIPLSIHFGKIFAIIGFFAFPLTVILIALLEKKKHSK